MPVKAEEREGKWRVVNVETDDLERNAAGTPVDGGHDTRGEAEVQVRALNARKGVRAELVNALRLGLPGFLTDAPPDAVGGLAIAIKTGDPVGPFPGITAVPVGVLELLPVSELKRLENARHLFWVPLEIGEPEAIAGDAARAALTHNSETVDDEPAWGEVEKNELPDVAFADLEARSFPHHFVRNAERDPETGRIVGGELFLHRGGLGTARAAAAGARSGQEASQKVIDHLAGHPSAEDLAG